VTDDVTDDPPRRTGRIVVATVCAVVLLGGGVFAVGTLFRDGGHSKLEEAQAPRTHWRADGSARTLGLGLVADPHPDAELETNQQTDQDE